MNDVLPGSGSAGSSGTVTSPAGISDSSCFSVQDTITAKHTAKRNFNAFIYVYFNESMNSWAGDAPPLTAVNSYNAKGPV